MSFSDLSFPAGKGECREFSLRMDLGQRWPLCVWGQSFYLHHCVTLNLHRKRRGLVDLQRHRLACGRGLPDSRLCWYCIVDVLMPAWGRPEYWVTLCRRICCCLTFDLVHWQPLSCLYCLSCLTGSKCFRLCAHCLFKMIANKYLGQK